MPGDGTKLDIIPNNPPPARLLDLTRTVRRAERTPTGVDRVERAYLRHLLDEKVPLWGLVRTAYGYLLLDQRGLGAVRQELLGERPWGPLDLLSRVSAGQLAARRRAEAGMRRQAVARAIPPRLTHLLKRYLPPGTVYVNVGHSNLTTRVLGALRAARGRVAVMIHDVIPLEFPQFQREGSVDRFRDMLFRVAGCADVILYNSADTRVRTEAVIRAWGPVPAGLVAYPGLDLALPSAADLPVDLPPDRPYFVCVGTLEPRKNIGFLLDLWDDLGPSAPPLLLVGTRGWRNEEVFARLDNLPAGSPVREVAGLSDAAVAALVKDASAVLFPTLAEGFGLPAAEAAAVGTPILCNDLPVLREYLGKIPVYASVSDRYLWTSAVTNMAEKRSEPQENHGFERLEWSEHFKLVLRLI